MQRIEVSGDKYCEQDKGKKEYKNSEEYELENWKGCDICQLCESTQRFDGTLGDRLYVCYKCYMNLLKFREKRKVCKK